MIDEKILISKAKEGDNKAFEEIISLYEKRVFSTIYYMVKNENEVEDIAQEVFIKIYRNLKNFKEESSLYTWIYRITINVCIDELKKKKNVVYIDEKLETADGEMEIQLEDTAKGPEHLAEDEELKQKITNCIRKLPIDQRTMIVLRDIKGFTYMEIAEMTKINLGTVKSKINRARTALKQILEEDGTFLEYNESNN
ncbi:MAG: sigma-70 family RNA polymerase sigma factor [Clostridia bacterium]|nr:sigma-70 family RNA polymerase sigma factor [Clostridia bacterium]